VKWLNSNRWWWLVTIAAAVAAPPLLLRAQPQGFDIKRGKVSAMPQNERDRLTNNFNTYLKLTEDQREHYRRLHQSLQQDQQENGGRYTAARDAYVAWVSSLPAFQQQQLTTATDPTVRINLVAEFLEEQEQRQAMDELRRISPQNRFAFFGTPVLSASELATLMEEVEKGVTLNPEQRQRLDEKSPGIERHLEFFKILGEKKYRINQVIDEARLQRLLDALPERAREKLLNRPTRQDRPPTRQDQVFGMIWTVVINLRKETELQMLARQPDPNKLQEFVKQWPADKSAELDELMDLSPDDFVQHLRERYAAQNLELDFEVVRQTFPPEWPRPRGPGFGGGRRSSDGGGSQRGQQQ